VGETGVVSLCEGFEGRLGRWRDKGAALVVGRLIGTRAYLGLLLVGIVINRDGRTVDVNNGGKATGDSGGEAVNGDLIVGEILVAWIGNEFTIAVKYRDNTVEDLVYGIGDIG